MKKYLLVIVALLTFSQVNAQSPNKISYQAVIRGASNNLIFNSEVSMRFSILQGSESGTVMYIETQKPTTNENGLVSTIIGNGVPGKGDLNTIDWSDGPFFLRVETNPLGGYDYTITGTTQLLSVPYALYSGHADNVSGKIAIGHGGTGASNLTEARRNLGLAIDSARVTEGINRILAAQYALSANLAADYYLTLFADSILTAHLATEVTNSNNALATKEALANKSTSVTSDGASNTKYPSVKSVKTYVDAAAKSDSTALVAEIANRTSNTYSPSASS